MIKFTKQYDDKIDSCLSAFTLLNANIGIILSSYQGKTFPNSRIKKSELFGNVLKKRLTCPQFQYLTDRCSLTKYRDKRCPHEYGVELILGWLVEDAVLDRLVSSGLRAKLYGEDKDREFLNAGQISAIPDIEIETNNGKRYIEVLTDWSNTWRGKNHADLRYDKHSCLTEYNALLLGISPLDNSGFLIEISKDNSLFKENYIYAWHKKGYTYIGIKEQLENINEIFDRLNSL